MRSDRPGRDRVRDDLVESDAEGVERQGSHKPVGSFLVRGVDGVDDVHGSDGLAIASRPVGRFTEGLMVTHDEPDSGPSVDDTQDPTNFSYVQWGDVARTLGLRLR